MTRPAPAATVAGAPPGVRLDVRLGRGRPTPHDLLDGCEFVVGGAATCQLVLPGSGVPAAVGRFVRLGDAVTFRRLDPAFPVLLNGELAGMNPRPLTPGDRVAVGPADITLNLDGAHLRPAFFPITAEVETPTPVEIDFADERRQLIAEREALAEQARELEADRVLWYRRRQEIEAELSARPAAVDDDGRAAQLEATRQELEGIRQSLHQQYEGRREQLAQMQEVIRTATADLQDRRQRLDADLETRLAARRAELDAEYAARLGELARRPPAEAAREQDLQAREDRLAAERENFERHRHEHADALLRLDRLQAAAEGRSADADRQAAEIDEKYDQLRRDSRELEETVALAGAEQERLAAEAARLGRQKADLDAHANKLAERSAQVEAQQATLAVLRATLERREEEARQEAAQMAADRARLDDAQRELDSRLHEAERLRGELITVEAGTAERERVAAERAALLEVTLAEIQQQKDTAAAEVERLRQKEADLDARTADTAEQTALLRARLQQALDLQARLEADRTSVREREVSLTDADVARQTFQEQLRRRADELTARSRHLDDAGRRLADDKAELDRLKAEAVAGRDEFAKKSAELAAREAALARQVQRLQETGRATAAARKELAATRAEWEAEREKASTDHAARAAELAALLQQAPLLDAQAKDATDRLAAARELLRGQMGELHAFAGQTRGELDAVRAELRAEADRLTAREAAHRLATSEFRQQLLGWQATIAEQKQSLGRKESTAEAQQAAVEEAAAALAAREAALVQERAVVAVRRQEVDRHLGEMQAWYQERLKELADGVDRKSLLKPADLDPADRQLGDLLLDRGLVDPDSLAALQTDARRQRKPLRRTLLESGVLTIHQLSLIESGDLGRLHFGRLRVVERVRANPREAVYRVSDPDRPAADLLLRHLADAEMDDAVRPDEFRQRFAAVAGLDARHLWATHEVLDLHGRPAALQEQPAGLPASDWPPEVATPGVWLRLVMEAAAGLSVAHAAGLVHGRLSGDAVWLAPDGVVKLSGVGEPGWLAGGNEGSATDDLRALGKLADGWARLGGLVKKRGRAKPFPDTLLAVVRRLLADPESPMADTAAGANPYGSAEDLLDDLEHLGKLFPCPPDAWRALAAADGDLRQSA